MNEILKKNVFHFMRHQVHDFVDDCNEVSMTLLAEWACDYFDLWDGDDTPEDLYEMSFKVAEEWSAKPW